MLIGAMSNPNIITIQVDLKDLKASVQQGGPYETTPGRPYEATPGPMIPHPTPHPTTVNVSGNLNYNFFGFDSETQSRLLPDDIRQRMASMLSTMDAIPVATATTAAAAIDESSSTSVTDEFSSFEDADETSSVVTSITLKTLSQTSSQISEDFNSSNDRFTTPPPIGDPNALPPLPSRPLRRSLRRQQSKERQFGRALDFDALRSVDCVVPSGSPCQRYNGKGCDTLLCLYKHICLGCGGKHPVGECTTLIAVDR